MTREEAIRLIGWLKCTTNREDDLEAIDMAIEALSADTSSDLISRADAIEAVLTYFIPWSHTGERGEHEEDFVRTIFNALPSADALLIQEIDFHKKVSRIEAEKVVDLEHKLADMVSVVRCKDCRFSEIFQNDSSGVMAMYCRAFTFERMVAEDDYCSYGERREE